MPPAPPAISGPIYDSKTGTRHVRWFVAASASLVALAFLSVSCETTGQGTFSGSGPAGVSPENQAKLDEAMEAAEASAAANRFAEREIVSYTVEDGDTLWEIARDHKVGIADIRSASGLQESETVIKPGQVLRIPLPEGVTSTGSDEIPAAGQPPGEPGSDAGRPIVPTGLPEGVPPAPVIRPAPLSPAESGLPAPPPPPGDDG